jgi:hypothetical protein
MARLRRGVNSGAILFSCGDVVNDEDCLIQEALVQSALEVFAKPDLTRVLANSEY